MAVWSSGTLKSIRLTFGEVRQDRAHGRRELAWVHAVGSLANEDAVLSAGSDLCLASAGLEPHYGVGQAEAGAADAGHPRTNLERVIHAHGRDELGLCADDR